MEDLVELTNNYMRDLRVAENILSGSLLGTMLPVIPVADGELVDRGSADAIRRLENLTGLFLGDAPDVGAHELGLGVPWVGPQQFAENLAYELLDGWSVASPFAVSNFIEIGAPTGLMNHRLMLTNTNPDGAQSFILVTFEPSTGERRWSRFDEILRGEPDDQIMLDPIFFRDGLGATLVQRDGVTNLLGARVDHDGVFNILAGVEPGGYTQDIQNDLFTFVRSLVYEWNSTPLSQPMGPSGIVPAGTASNPSYSNAATPGILGGDVTFTSASIIWNLDGDENQNATATVKFRRPGTTEWRDARDLSRVVHSDVVRETGEFRARNLLTGSIFNFAPGTNYEIIVTLRDVDGGFPSLVTTLTTRSVPRTSGSRTTYEVSNIAELNAVRGHVRPGDMVLLHGGDYGYWSVKSGGNNENPVLYRAFGDGEVHFSGIGINASHIWLDGLNIGTGGISRTMNASSVSLHVTRSGGQNTLSLSQAEIGSLPTIS